MIYATQEAAISAICTHVCRIYSRIKLSPHHCDIRREKAKKTASGLNPASIGYSPYTECRGCKGPILPAEVPAPKPELVIDLASPVAPCTPVKLCKYKTHAGGFLPMDADHFYKDKRKKDGFSSYCIPCQIECNLAAHKKREGKRGNKG